MLSPKPDKPEPKKLKSAYSIFRGYVDHEVDNAFIRIDDFAQAQQLSDQLKPDNLHRILDRYATLCCPVLDIFEQEYHWSLMQTEYSTDLAFRSDAALQPLYEELSRQAVISVKAENVSSFLGKKITPQLAQELGSRLSTRIEGTCIKHYLGSVSIKIYDKFKRVLRIETTTNDVSFFKAMSQLIVEPKQQSLYFF